MSGYWRRGLVDSETVYNSDFYELRKRENIGSASGKIISAKSRKPIANAIVDMKGMSAVTDEQGNFRFPDIYAGDYEVNVDSSHLDDNNHTTASGKGVNLRVTPNKESKIVIPLIVAASLTRLSVMQEKQI